MDLALSGRTYIVTGASAGLGLASAQALAADGANVIIASRDRDRIDAAAQTFPTGASVLPVVADLANDRAPARLVETAIDTFGGLDGAVISVGGPPAARLEDTEDDQWRQAFDSVFLGGLRMARAVLDTPFDAERQMAVTMVLSSSVKSPIPGLAISNGLRPGLAMAAKTLADEYGARGGRVNVLLPGRIDTDRVRSLDAGSGDADASRRRAEATIPLGRYGTAEEFGRVAAFVTSPAASYLSGIALPVDGGALRSL